MSNAEANRVYQHEWEAEHLIPILKEAQSLAAQLTYSPYWTDYARTNEFSAKVYAFLRNWEAYDEDSAPLDWRDVLAATNQHFPNPGTDDEKERREQFEIAKRLFAKRT